MKLINPFRIKVQPEESICDNCFDSLIAVHQAGKPDTYICNTCDEYEENYCGCNNELLSEQEQISGVCQECI